MDAYVRGTPPTRFSEPVVPAAGFEQFPVFVG